MYLPDYANSILNIPNSILAHYGLTARHSTLPLLDGILARGFRNIVLFVFDGLSMDALGAHLPEESFLRRHVRDRISSVFIPTTTAATTSLMTGLSPAEHGWMGWSLYFRSLERIIDVYPNTVKDTDEPAAGYNVGHRFLPFRSITSLIGDEGIAASHTVSPFGDVSADSLEELLAETGRLCREDGPHYLYCYHTDPDYTMHRTGCYSPESAAAVQAVDKGMEALCDGLSDTLVLVVADHGLVDTEYNLISDYPALESLLVRPVSLEARAASFGVRPGCREEFAGLFRGRYGEDFYLCPREEVRSRGLFGPGRPGPFFDDFVGDFIAISLCKKGFVMNESSRRYRAAHGGLTAAELEVPLIAVEC